MKTKFKPIHYAVLLALPLSLLPGCKTGVDAAQHAKMVVVAIDNTDSMNKDIFADIKDRQINELILSKLRTRDSLNFLTLDGSSGEPKVLTVEGPRHRWAKRQEDWVAKNLQPLKITRSKATDIAGVIEYGRHLRELEGKAKKPRKVFIAVFTDGKIEGKQTPIEGELPLDVPVAFIGVDNRYEKALHTWATNQAKLKEAQLTIMRYDDYEVSKGQFMATWGHTQHLTTASTGDSP